MESRAEIQCREDGVSTDHLYRLTRLCFDEMRAAGITCVGEFHYLHHSSKDGGQDCDLDPVVLRAAQDAGVRLVLLYAAYTHETREHVVEVGNDSQ